MRDDARAEILAAVRAALADGPVTDSPVTDGPLTGDPVVAPPGWRPDPQDDSALVDRFVERVADYRARAHRCSPQELPAAVADALAGVGSVVVPPGLGIDVEGAVVDTGELGRAELDAVAAVVTRARVAIAETGTVVLDHDASQGRRILSLLPDLHVCIVDVAQVVPDVPEATAVLDPARPQTWISGPSATSDIELDRVEGVHGPRTLHVIVVG